MPELAEISREIDRIIQSLVDLKSSLAVKDRKLKPSNRAEAKTREDGNKCTICSKPLEIVNGRPPKDSGCLSGLPQESQ